MKLFIDSGNTRLKWKLHNGERWLDRDSDALYQPLSLPELIANSSLKAALEHSHEIWAANVAGFAVETQLKDLACLHNKTIHFIHASHQRYGLINHYEPAHQLGSDRYAALVGARQWLTSHPCNTILINCGTAITLEYLRQDGHFYGGLIMPGLFIMQQSLVRSTALLTKQDGHWSMMPKNTADAITTGIIQATIGAIEKTIDLWSADSPLTNNDGPIKQILLTGGNADKLAKHLSHPVHIRPNLVLEGLLVIASEEHA